MIFAVISNIVFFSSSSLLFFFLLLLTPQPTVDPCYVCYLLRSISLFTAWGPEETLERLDVLSELIFLPVRRFWIPALSHSHPADCLVLWQFPQKCNVVWPTVTMIKNHNVHNVYEPFNNCSVVLLTRLRKTSKKKSGFKLGNDEFPPLVGSAVLKHHLKCSFVLFFPLCFCSIRAWFVLHECQQPHLFPAVTAKCRFFPQQSNKFNFFPWE